LIDLHCHLLPGLDDGAATLADSLAMARMAAADGVGVIACTPHIARGVYDNDGATIRARVEQLQSALDAAEIPIALVVGADAHIAPDFVAGLRSGAIPSLNDTRYVLVEPPHHFMPPMLEEFFAGLLSAGYVPVLTHPERLTWLSRRYDVMRRLFDLGVWMQITAGALLGEFGAGPRFWAERMLRDGLGHILATDAHDSRRRRPCLRAGFEAAAALLGEEEAANLVYWRPLAILENRDAAEVAAPLIAALRPPARAFAASRR
jgi:protein-tyrosine phosphatase